MNLWSKELRRRRRTTPHAPRLLGQDSSLFIRGSYFLCFFILHTDNAGNITHPKKRICLLWKAHSLLWYVNYQMGDYFLFSARSISTAIETVAPTMGLLPIPRKPIIST